MFDDVFITEYLKIITEADKDNKDQSDEDDIKLKKIRIAIEKDETVENEIPELEDQINNFFDGITNQMIEEHKDFDSPASANKAIRQFINQIKKGIDKMEISQELKEQLDKKYINSDEKTENDKEDKKTEEKPQEGQDDNKSDTKKTSKTPDVKAEVKKDKNGKAEVKAETNNDENLGE